MEAPNLQEFVDSYGIRWVYDPSTRSYQQATHLERNTWDQATGGDADNLFATDQNPLGNWEKTKNPMAEGIMAHTAGFRPGQQVLYTPQGGSIGNPTSISGQVFNIRDDGTVGVRLENGGRLSLPPLMAQMSLTPVNSADYNPFPPTTPEGIEQEAESMVRHAEYTNTLQTPEPLDSTEQQYVEGQPMHPPDCPCKQCEFRRKYDDPQQQVNHSWGPFFEREPHRNRMNYDDSFPSMISKTAQGEMPVEDLFGGGPITPNSRIAWFVHPDTQKIHFSPPGGSGHSEIPEYQELMMNPRENIPRIKHEGHFLNGELRHYKGGSYPELDNRLMTQYMAHRQRYPSIPPLNIEGLHPTQLNSDPNPIPNIKLFGSKGRDMLDFPADRGGPHYFQRLAWEESQPSLSSCPDCQSPMIDRHQERFCPDCGGKQPIIYAQNKQGGLLGDIAGGAALALPWALGPEVGAPADAAMLGADAGLAGGAAAAGGDAAAGGGLGGLMDAAMGKGKQYLRFEGLHNLLNGGQGGGGGTPQQQQQQQVPMDLSGTVARTAGEEIGLATKNNGENTDPNIHSTDGLTNRAGDDPSDVKDHDISGSGSEALEGLQKTFEEIMKKVMDFASNPEESGESDPVMQALDQLLEAHAPGYRGDPSGEATVVIEAEPEGNGEESAVGEESDSHDEHEKVAAVDDGMYAKFQPLMQQWMSGQIDEQTFMQLLQEIKNNQSGAAQPPPYGNSGYEMAPTQNDNMGALGQAISHVANLPMSPAQPGSSGSVPVGPPPGQMGNATGMDGPCSVCGGNHATAMHGVATPGQDAMHAVAHLFGEIYKDPTIKEARRPKMCPYHSDLVDYSLQFGDPKEALSVVSPQMYGTQWCKSGQFSATCNFKPAMVKQDYWDQREKELSDKRLERQQEEVLYEQQEEAILPDAEVSETDMDSTPDPGGYSPSEVSDISAVGAPMTASTHVAFADAVGQPLIEGQTYKMHSPQYNTADNVTIDHISPNKLDVTIHSDLMSYKDEITPQQLEQYAYQFEPETHPAQESQEFTPETNNEYKYYDNPGGQTDLADLPTPVSHTEAEPLNGGLDYLLEGTGIDPATARVAGRDYSHQEQLAFISEAGQARNLAALDLAGTHYGPLDAYMHSVEDEISLW